MEGSITTKPSSQPIMYGEEKIIEPQSIEKSSRLRTLYSSKKYSNLRGSTESIDRLSALHNVSKKKPEYIEKHIDLTINTISSALSSTNSNVVQKSIEVLRDLSNIFCNELKSSYWIFYYVSVRNLCSLHQQILDDSLQLIYDMHSCFQPEYFISTINELIPNAKKSSQATSFLFCLFQLLIDCRKDITSYCPTYIELLLTMKHNYKPMRKLCHIIGEYLNEVFTSNELKELIESNLQNDDYNIRKFCKLYGLHRMNFTVEKLENSNNNNNNNEKEEENYKDDILPTQLKSIIMNNNDINNYNDYYDSNRNSVLSDTEKSEIIKDLLEESQDIVNTHEIKYRESDVDVLLVDRESEVSTDEWELEDNNYNNNKIKSNNNNNYNNNSSSRRRYDSSDDEHVNKHSSLKKGELDYGLLCSDTDEMKVDTSLSADGRRRRPQSEKLLPISFDIGNNNQSVQHSKLNQVVNYRDLAPSPVEEASLEDEVTTPMKVTRSLNPVKKEEENSDSATKTPQIKDLVKESEDLLDKSGIKRDFGRSPSIYDVLLNADKDSYVEYRSDLSSGDVSHIEDEKPKLTKQLSMDEENLKNDEEKIHSILLDDSPVHQNPPPNANPPPIN